MAISITMDFINGNNYALVLQTALVQEVILTANIAWEEGVKAFVREATESVFIDTGMSAFTLIAPLDAIGDPVEETNKQIEILSQRKRIKAKPYRELTGQYVKGKFRDALTAYSLAKRNTKVLEMSLTNSILKFDYTVSAWQISKDYIMNDEPINLGFKAFEDTVNNKFSTFETDVNFKKFLDPFSNAGVKLTSTVTG